ncbi:MAG: TolC family protein [Gemmatimonadota bacterium]
MLVPLALGIVLLQHPAPAADSLTLDAALQRAWARRGQSAIAAARVAQARASLRVAGSVPNPVASYSNTQDPPHQHALLDQSFEWLLRRGTDRGAAAQELNRARFDSSQVAADLAADVRRAFFGALAARRGLELAREQSALADSLAELASRRLSAGDISVFERDQVALEAARAGLLVSRARETQRIVQADLARQLAWEEAGSPAPAGALDAGLEEAIEEPLADSLLFVRSARADSAAASLRARSAFRARLPLPSFNLGADWDDPGSGGRLLRVFGISIPLPLWQHGSGAAALAQAQADESAQVAREERLRATSALASARATLEEAALRARVARDSLLPAAARLRQRAAQAYRAGETGVLPVLDALRSERDVTSGALDELLTYQEARAAWNSLVGIAR